MQDGTLGASADASCVMQERSLRWSFLTAMVKRSAFSMALSHIVIADPATRVIYETAQVWNRSYILGTDSLGRDILTRLMYGTRVSLLVAFIAVVGKHGDRYCLWWNFGLCWEVWSIQ